MKRRLLIATLALAFSGAAFAADEKEAKGPSGLNPTTEMVLLWVNFAILAGGLAYLIKKYGGPALEQRRQHISQDIVEAAKIKADAETRSADVDKRLANLEADLASLRAESRRELDSLERQIAGKTAAEATRIQTSAEQEIAAAAKSARLELKRYSAELAVQLAAQKILARMTPGAQEALVDEFVTGLEHPGARAQAS